MSISYTWEEKIENLVRLAKAAGRFLNAEGGDYSPSVGSDYLRDARRAFSEAYEEFCAWRHDAPYVVDELRTLLSEKEVPV